MTILDRQTITNNNSHNYIHSIRKIVTFALYLPDGKDFDLGGKDMATPIRPIPILSGETLQRFIQRADTAEKASHTQDSEISKEDFKKVLAKANFQ